jgi:hypothetical protein
MAQPYTAKQAQDKLEINQNRFYYLVRSGFIKPITLPDRKQRLYTRESVDKLARSIARSREALTEEVEDAVLTFAQATPDDVPGIYEVAHELFGHTTPIEQRIPMVEACPMGNYVVKRGSEVVAYIIIQPLKSERLKAFMRGKIRGWDLTAEDLDCFEPGKEVECLVKSLGSTEKYGDAEQRRFAQRLLRGVVRALVEMGRKGITISAFYATSESEQGISVCLSADMTHFSKPLGNRLTFVVNVEAADNKPFNEYKTALVQWRQEQI